MGSAGSAPPGNPEDAEGVYRQNLSPIVSEITARQRWIILISVGIVTGIEISNRISINVLLPDMQGNVAANSDEISWVLTLYNVGFLCSIALSSWFARLFGSRRHFLFSILFYATGAIGCALSPHSLARLLAARTVMGFGGGAFLVRVVTLIGILFPGRARVRAVTCLYVVLFAFQIPYPLAMGAINDAFHWNYAFLLDMPFLVISAILIWRFLPPGHLSFGYLQDKLDLWGVGLLISGMVSLQAALSRGERDLWFDSAWICGALLCSLICLVLFIWWDTRKQNRYPVLHLCRIWQQQSLRASFLIVLIVGATLGSALFVVPQYLRTVQNYSATQTGGFISLYATGLGIGLLLTVRAVMPRIGGAATLGLGLCMLTGVCTACLYIWTPDTPSEWLAALLFLEGFSLGLMLLGAANLAVGQLSQADLSEGETTYFFTRQLGNSFGVTAATVVLDHRMTLHSSRLLDTANRLNPVTRTTLAQYQALIHRNGGGSSNPVLGALQIFQANVLKQSRLLSFVDISFYLAALCVAGLVLLAICRAEKSKTVLHLHVF